MTRHSPERNAPHFDAHKLGGTKAMRNLSSIFLEMREYLPERKRRKRWPRSTPRTTIARYGIRP